MGYQRWRFRFRLVVSHCFYGDFLQLLLSLFLVFFVQVIKDASSQGIPFHIHNCGGSVPGEDQKQKPKQQAFSLRELQNNKGSWFTPTEPLTSVELDKM